MKSKLVAKNTQITVKTTDFVYKTGFSPWITDHEIQISEKRLELRSKFVAKNAQFFVKMTVFLDKTSFSPWIIDHEIRVSE